MTDEAVHRHSPPEVKIALFRGLFRGREDVYARRFESKKTGKVGYQPACGNEWDRVLCDKRRVKCLICQNRRFLPLTDEVIRWHLSGRDETGKDCVVGVYPMLQDETCFFFLAVDFDKKSWSEDARAYLETCRHLGLTACLERSRSGRGGHIWLIFQEPIPAALARKLGSHILTETMERRPDMGLDSYDRLFPNQDTLPTGGFGNLIALPMQKQARERGNSLFLDDQGLPYPDQWAFLSTIQKIGRQEVETIVQKAESRGRVVGVRLAPRDEDEDTPWTSPPSRRRQEPPLVGRVQESMELVLGNQIYVAKGGLSPGLRNRLIRLAAFQNPEFYRLQAMRQSTYAEDRITACAEDYPNHIGLPRGCLEDVQVLLSDLKIKPLVWDERCEGKPLEVSFHGALRPEQKAAAETMNRNDIGVLSATTDFGKTVLAAWLIAQRRVNTIVLVHRRQLMEQWVDRLCTFLGLPMKAIGGIGGGKKKPTGMVDVALIQSLVRKGVVDDLVGEYGHVVVDECHRLSAPSFEQVARRAKAKFVTGLSATVTRKDGRHPIILRGGMDRKELATVMAHLSTIPDNEERVLLATGRYIGEGFDEARLDTLLLTLPVSWRGTIAQYAGRLHRLHDRKREVRIYDYADLNAPMLARMFDRRCRGYEAVGYTVVLPASAIAGWPAEVTLPIDPQWKKDYAASVRRLVRDGVNTPLATLFVHVTRSFPPDLEGVARARSASEAFLYRRLETLPESAGKFRLNVELPIPFDGWGKMEVDLLCAEARLAIELDGAQHLSGPDAYRRDCRKDCLLQQNGYFVLRFLAEDVSKQLDDVLDTILRTLTNRMRH